MLPLAALAKPAMQMAMKLAPKMAGGGGGDKADAQAENPAPRSSVLPGAGGGGDLAGLLSGGGKSNKGSEGSIIKSLGAAKTFMSM
jgi:hypothetical protein